MEGFGREKLITTLINSSCTHLLLDAGGDGLDLGDERGWIETAVGRHAGTRLVDIGSLLLGLLNITVNGSSLGGVHYSPHVYTLLEEDLAYMDNWKTDKYYA